MPRLCQPLALGDRQANHHTVLFPHETARDVAQRRRDDLENAYEGPNAAHAADGVNKLLLLVGLDAPLRVIGVLKRPHEHVGCREHVPGQSERADGHGLASSTGFYPLRHRVVRSGLVPCMAALPDEVGRALVT